jgi:FkbM family methyltransferase
MPMKTPRWVSRFLPFTVKRAARYMLDADYRRTAKERRRLKCLPRYVAGTSDLLGKSCGFVDALTFRIMYDEFFVREAYRFRARTETPLILDVGSNIGLSVIYFKKLYPKSRIVAFEPDPTIFAALSMNCESFGLEGVELVQKAVWDIETTLQFWQEGSLAGRIAEGQAESNISVPTCRLRSYLSQPVDFLKVDVEGAEVRILRDCADLLPQVGNIFVEHHSFEGMPQDIEVIVSLLRSAGFRLYFEAASDAPQPLLTRQVVCGMDVQTNIYGFRS